MQNSLSYKKYISSSDSNSLFDNIPREFLSHFKQAFKHLTNDNLKFRTRYRGERLTDSFRNKTQKRSECLKRNALTFSVYCKNKQDIMKAKQFLKIIANF